ncbi:mitotic-spindle organizing protein 2-like [Diadema setosum]|uniref:mitotic-spindle organizing protein 2-like n=1 Tax=Diadema setosum TaxID=31175 RepID=UPI003B3AB05E
MTSTQRTTQSHKYAIPGKRAKDALNKDEQDLYDLCSLAGVEMSPAVFRIVMSLLKMNVSPIAIVQMLRSMVNPKVSISTTSLTTSSTAESDVMGLSPVYSHSAVKRSASATMAGGGGSGTTSTYRNMKGASRSATSVRSDQSGRPRSTRSNART